MYINSNKPNSVAKVELKFDSTNKFEQQLADRIGNLENEVETNRTELKQSGVSKRLFDEIADKNAEISDLQIKLRFEGNLKERFWKQFKDKTTFEDFSRLWNERLRDDAILSNGKENTDALSEFRRSSYAKW